MTSKADRLPAWPLEIVAAMAGREFLGLFVVRRLPRELKFEEFETFIAARLKVGGGNTGEVR
jgi:hypothetical protein